LATSKTVGWTKQKSTPDQDNVDIIFSFGGAPPHCSKTLCKQKNAFEKRDGMMRLDDGQAVMPAGAAAAARRRQSSSRPKRHFAKDYF
jgi:hypothetical protein